MFWSSAVLTGNRTRLRDLQERWEFWSSAVLTGNRTWLVAQVLMFVFWSSAVLTGNRTDRPYYPPRLRFGAVPF